MDYLYGASVQGIQSFIFQTNKLKEIVGASQLVNRIVKEEFAHFCKKILDPPQLVNEADILINVAGNLKCILDKTTCQKIVKQFPKHISNYAPGITISQAVVELSTNLKDDIDALERKLKTQRNKAAIPVDFGFMGLERARRTGGVAFKMIEKKFADRGTDTKIQDREKNTRGLFDKFTSDTIRSSEVPFDLNHITKKHDNDWIAIVHADGNGLGYLLSNLGESVKDDNEKAKTVFRRFSIQLEKATQLAAQTAFETVLSDQLRQELKEKKMRLPFRPVVLGGDDMTVIIRADLAFEFTKSFLKAFEEETKTHLAFLKTEYGLEEFDKGLTACAGIAYVKTAYPFHYGVHLAESLTAAAKKFSKNIDAKRAPSSLYFYKVQASFLDDLASIKKRTHFAKASAVSFDYGPYLIHEGSPNVDMLEEKLAIIQNLSEKEGRKISIGKLRNWLAELNQDANRAAFMLNRMYQIDEQLEAAFPKSNFLEPTQQEEATHQTIIHDLIVLNSF